MNKDNFLPEVNEDEMIGYILREVSDDHSLYYGEVLAVLDAELKFLREKGIAKGD